jgi:hypothetical protein
MAGQATESGELPLRYPLFAVLSEQDGGEDGLVVVDVNGQDAVPLFRSREVAELYAEQVRDAEMGRPFHLQEYRGDEELAHLLAQLPPAVTHVVWDVTLQPQAVRITPVADLRRILATGG